MASLQTSSLIIFSSSSSSTSCSSSSSSKSRRINAVLQLPELPKDGFTAVKAHTRNMVQGLNLKVVEGFTNATPLEKNNNNINNVSTRPELVDQLYAILEAVADRVEMHSNIGQQRDNWNSLLLNSINTITLTASTMAGVAAATTGGVLALKLSSALLFSAATGMLLVMNKIQPSQLAEEQRNAARLFRQLQRKIETLLALRSPTERDVKDTMEKVLALDKAYPLPLLGAMIEKFPKTFEPAVWWPENDQIRKRNESYGTTLATEKNGWSAEVEAEMREIVEVVKAKDREDYERLGSLALKINKSLAIAGPLLTGIAALMSSPFVGNGAVVAATAGALASAVNAFEHGGQVGMVIEMYRNSAGFFKLMENSIEAALEESDVEKRENGELFRMKVALDLGRSFPQLEDIAQKSASSRIDGTPIDEFASKLF